MNNATLALTVIKPFNALYEPRLFCLATSPISALMAVISFKNPKNFSSEHCTGQLVNSDASLASASIAFFNSASESRVPSPFQESGMPSIIEEFLYPFNNPISRVKECIKFLLSTTRSSKLNMLMALNKMSSLSPAREALISASDIFFGESTTCWASAPRVSTMA